MDTFPPLDHYRRGSSKGSPSLDEPLTKRLINSLHRQGLHLHWRSINNNFINWVMIERKTPLCKTDRCFRLKLRNFKRA